MAAKAQGAPTKEFFVGMLTRDIELNDAILDLLDNCLDGVVRQKGHTQKRDSPDYYKGYNSQITVSKDSLIIEDNCGGIPRDIAEKYAFRMGRSSTITEEDLPTVGIYGIGMKRAIFKIGKSATVITRNENVLYRVSIPLDWASKEDEWDFPIDDLNIKNLLESGGTKIEVTHINPGIANTWDTDDKLDHFCNDLIKTIQQCYSFIIQKGFEIIINGVIVEPLPIQLLVGDAKKGSALKPFLYKQTFEDVNVSLAVGFYAPPPSPEDMDDENTMKRTTPDAGWTIVCNDRVVLYNDKSHLTGWGEAQVPQYHTQFVGIRGIVVFESNNPKNLPMTTTKRGIDTSSNIYAVVKNKMRQGLKMFTDYTNRWKGRNEGERVFSKAAKSIAIDQLVGSKADVENTANVKFHKSKEGLVFNPELPRPLNDKPYKSISFSKGTEDIYDVVEYFFMDKSHSITPSQVGEKCFDTILDKAHMKEEK